MYRMFGAYVQRLREDRGLSQNKAAARVDLSQPQWSRIEDGFCWPTEYSIANIAIALKIPTPEEFLGQSFFLWDSLTGE